MAAWDLDKTGNIILCPMIRYQAATLAETACGVRVEFARTEAQLGKGQAPEVVQLALTPAQALALAEDLRKAAEQILRLRPEGKPS